MELFSCSTDEHEIFSANKYETLHTCSDAVAGLHTALAPTKAELDFPAYQNITETRLFKYIENFTIKS